MLSREYIVVEASYTRPADTTQYAADDAFSDDTASPSALTFSNCGRRRGSGGRIFGATIIGTANQATKPQLELYLFDDSVTATADNAEFGLTDADAAKCVGIIKFATTDFSDLDVTAGANGNMYGRPATGPDFAYRCLTTGRDLYGLLKVTNTYTPVSAEVLTVQLHVEQD